MTDNDRGERRPVGSTTDPDGVRGTPERSCSSCGGSPTWLVTARYGNNDIAGRLLLHCDECRRRAAGQLGTVMPLVMFDLDRELLLTMLYQSGVTTSDPDIAAEIIGVTPGQWTETAHRAIAASH